VFAQGVDSTSTRKVTQIHRAERRGGLLNRDSGVSVGPWAQTIPWPKIAAIATVVVLAVTGYLLRDKLFAPKAAAVRAPMSVLVADFQNNTSDPLFDDTLEPMFNVALEGAGFINAYSRGNARQLFQLGPTVRGERAADKTIRIDGPTTKLTVLSWLRWKKRC
jgi:hypothetical protein